VIVSQVVIGRLVIYEGATPDGPWAAVKPEDVPQWLQKPQTLGSMLEGNLAHNEDEPDGPWYAAVKCEDSNPSTPIVKPVERRILMPGEGHA
jgi:hypothetical protein